jgi:DNA-binding response OmpR family regulator
MRVLIIEDEDRLRHMMRLTLEEAAYDVGEAASGEAGLEQFGDGQPWDVVLLDQRLPGIDGLETLRRLKQRDARACVVMVTAFASIDLAVDAMKLGATDFLRKPVAPETVRGALAAAVHGRSEPRVGRPPAAAVTDEKPNIVYLTMNGFQIAWEDEGYRVVPESPNDHRFTVKHFAGDERHLVVVTVAPEELARVERLSRRSLKPQGGFWREQAERFLADYLWTEGRIPAGGHLTLTEVPRDTIDVAAAWKGE